MFAVKNSFILVVLALSYYVVQGYVPHGKEYYLTDALLKEAVDRMGRDLAAAADSYFDSSDSNERLLDIRAMKALEEEDGRYPLHLEGLAPPSLRDREFLQHSSLWGSPADGQQLRKPDISILSQPQMKTDPTLPAYCNPPNPCPVGYSAEDGCLEKFENTAAFSRKFQGAQECMCDTEHMFDCPVHDFDSPDLENSILNEMGLQDHHLTLVAKKFHNKVGNPYLQGEKLPIAAKKGQKLPKN